MISLSPYQDYSPIEWEQCSPKVPLTLTEADITRLRGFNETVSLAEVASVYLPLAHLLSVHMAAEQQLKTAQTPLNWSSAGKIPYIIGISGSVAVGKSTTSRLLQALLSRWETHPKVALVSTDGFLYPNQVLRQKGLMDKKGFPESFNRKKLIEFLWEVKSGQQNLQVPIYSHEYYDILSDHQHFFDKPDILILEGLNVLQKTPGDTTFVAEFLDFTIYVDAPTKVIEGWYLDRFMAFREKAANDSSLFFNQFYQMSAEQAQAYAYKVWKTINEANLIQNILPYRNQARLILRKDPTHHIEHVYLRKL